MGRGTWAGLCWQHTTQRYVCISIRRITGSLVNFQRRYICVSPQFWALSAISGRFHLLKGHKSWSPTRLSFHFMQSAAAIFKPSMFSCILLPRGTNYMTKPHQLTMLRLFDIRWITLHFSATSYDLYMKSHYSATWGKVEWWSRQGKGLCLGAWQWCFIKELTTFMSGMRIIETLQPASEMA